jgi:hypothetical protein
MRVILAAVLGLAFVGAASAQNNQKQQVQPAPRQGIRPTVQPRMLPNQMRNGVAAQGATRSSGAGQPKPGVIRGPAGALLKTKPANVVFNPKHKIGAAGARYNKQAFAFRRGGRFFKRHYYVGPDGGVYFYDESMSPDDPMLAAPDAVAGMTVCPPDSDDCQGMGEATGPGDDVAVSQFPLPGETQYDALKRIVYASWSPPPAAPVLRGELSVDANGQLVAYRFNVESDPISLSTIQTLLTVLSLNSAFFAIYANDAATSLDGLVRVGVEFDPALAKRR